VLGERVLGERGKRMREGGHTAVGDFLAGLDVSRGGYGDELEAFGAEARVGTGAEGSAIVLMMDRSRGREGGREFTLVYTRG